MVLMTEPKLPPEDAALALAGIALLAELRSSLGKPGILGAIARVVFKPTVDEQRCASAIVAALAELQRSTETPAQTLVQAVESERVARRSRKPREKGQ